MLVLSAKDVKSGVMDVNRVGNAWDVDLQNHAIMINTVKGLSHQGSKQRRLYHI